MMALDHEGRGRERARQRAALNLLAFFRVGMPVRLPPDRALRRGCRVLFLRVTLHRRRSFHHLARHAVGFLLKAVAHRPYRQLGLHHRPAAYQVGHGAVAHVPLEL